MLIIIGSISGSTLGWFSSQPYMWENNSLGNWASVGTILSLVLIPIAYFYKLNEKEKEQKQQIIKEQKLASRNIYGELLDAYEAIYGKKYPKDLLEIEFENKIVVFTNRFLNHDLYDGLIHSGKISFLIYELQQPIQDIYKKIKNHNYYIRHTYELQDKDQTDKISKNIFRYYELLGDDEERLLEEIDMIMKKLKNEFEFDIPR